MSSQTVGRLYQFPTMRRAPPLPSHWVEVLGRWAIACQGIAYLFGALLLVIAAFQAGRSPDVGEASGFLEGPLLSLLLWPMALSLYAFAVWRLLQGFADLEHIGYATSSAFIERVGCIASGAAHGALAVGASVVVFRHAQGAHVAPLISMLQHQIGTTPMIFGGLCLLGLGFHDAYEAYEGSFMKDYLRARMSMEERSRVARTGQIGLTARAVAFVLIGWFMVDVSAPFDGQIAQSVITAMTSMAHDALGLTLVAAVAIGLANFAIFCFSRARYRRFDRR